MTTETITWIPVTELLPNNDRLVLIIAPGCNEPIGIGWLCGIQWRLADGWPLIETPVTYWAEMPKGPQ